MIRAGILCATLLTAGMLLPAGRMAAQSPASTVVPAPAGTAHPASPSTASGQRSEPEANAGREQEDPAAALRAPSPSVSKLGSLAGLSPKTSVSVFNWINFLVLAAAVIYALAKMLPKAFRTRTDTIHKGIVEARAATEEARARLTAVEARLGRLDSEIATLRMESERGAAEEEQRMHTQAEEEKVRILQAAEQEISAASAAAQRSLRAYAAEIAVQRAAAQLHITPEDDRVLIERFAGKLGTGGSRN